MTKRLATIRVEIDVDATNDRFCGPECVYMSIFGRPSCDFWDEPLEMGLGRALRCESCLESTQEGGGV